MTMFNPSENLSKQHFHSSVFGYGFGSYESFVHMTQLENEKGEGEGRGYDYSDYIYKRYSSQLQACLGSDLPLVKPMAEDESRTESVNEADSSSKDNNNEIINVNQEREKDKEEEEEGWLQLSIGGSQEKKSPGGRSGLVELDLLPPGPGGTSTSSTSYEHQKSLQQIFPHHHYQVPEIRPPRTQLISTTSLFLQQYPGTGSSSASLFPHHPQEIDWAFRPMAAASSSNYLPIAPPIGSHFSARPLPVLHAGIGSSTGPSIDFRVIDPPRRPHAGIWFSLQASLNQAKEPFLHQISKSYLRIKDGRMTIRLVLKYLVNKLQLDNESEIEIRCRGQQLQPYLTLQHVRDHIWSSNATLITLLPPQSSTTTAASNHVMLLHYGRSAT